MAPKHDSKADEATVSVNVDELRNSKDQVLMRLMALQSYIADLSKAYLEHTNNVINGGPATIEIPTLPGLSSNFDLVPRSPGAKSEGGEKKRKRRTHDPNAPKRALTPYFLYMQHNRASIAESLGKDAKPKDVAEEGTKIWQGMSAAQKEVWREMYANNFEKYKTAMANYKAGKGASAGDEDHDPAASQLQQDFAGAENDKDSDDESSESESEESGEDEASPSPPPKEKTPPPSSKRRRSSGKAAKAESPTKQSPQKKGKKSEPASAVKPVPESTGKRKGKKRKSEA